MAAQPSSTPKDPTPDEPAWIALAPALFVLLWSTGFLGARLSMPHAEPFSFLFVRFVIAAGLMALVAAAFRRRWPRNWTEVGHASAVGILLHGAYLTGVFWAVDRGLSAGVAALVVGLQPVLTAALAGLFLGERVRAWQWVGLVLGFAGVAMVVGEKLDNAQGDIWGLLAVTVSLVGITLSTLYQKRYCADLPLWSGMAVQYAAAAVVIGLGALLFESFILPWNADTIFAMAWLVLVLSLGTVALLMFLIQRGAAAKTASLFYLVPPVVAVEAYLLFGETLGGLAIAGMAATVVGVALVMRG